MERHVIEGLFQDHRCDVCGGVPSMFRVGDPPSGSDRAGDFSEYYCHAHLAWAYGRMLEAGTRHEPLVCAPTDTHDRLGYEMPAAPAPDTRAPPVYAEVESLTQDEPVRLEAELTTGLLTDSASAGASQGHAAHDDEQGEPAIITVRGSRGETVQLDAREVGFIVPGRYAQSTRIVFNSAPGEAAMEYEVREATVALAARLGDALGKSPVELLARQTSNAPLQTRLRQ